MARHLTDFRLEELLRIQDDRIDEGLGWLSDNDLGGLAHRLRAPRSRVTPDHSPASASPDDFFSYQ